MQKITIVGYGPFTKLMIQHMQDDFDIQVCSRDPSTKDKGTLSFEFVDNKTGLANNIIILSIPSQFLRSYLTDNHELINPNALVIDVCSVKEEPIKDMDELLPPTNQIVGTHPIFGPGSAAGGIKGLVVAVCPGPRGSSAIDDVRTYLKSKGLEVVDISPQEHDQEMAQVLSTTQYIGRAMSIIDLKKTRLRTPAYSALLKMKDIQGNDSWELFESIMSTDQSDLQRKNIRAALDSIDSRLNRDT